jgi:2-polyprenyl-6-methoxyphenol hydroxylase-like FAD-dependent oxidoreductase
LGIHDGTSYLVLSDAKLLAPYTQFPFTLALPQSKTVEVMLEMLKQVRVAVLRPFKVVSLRPSREREGNIEVGFESGEGVEAEYVVGADGGRSVVIGEDLNQPSSEVLHNRSAMKLEFPSRIPTATRSKTTAKSPTWSSAT